MSTGSDELSSVLASSHKGSPSKKKDASRPRKGARRELIFGDPGPTSSQKPKSEGKENKEPKPNLTDIEQKIPKTFLSTQSNFTPYLFGRVPNLGEGEIYIPNRFMSKVQENEKIHILAELHDFDLCVVGYVAVQPSAFSKPIYIFGRSGANISQQLIHKFNGELEKHLNAMREFTRKRSTIETELEKIKSEGSGKAQNSKKVNLEKEKKSIAKSLNTIPKEIRGLYGLSPDSSTEQIHTAVEEIQRFIDLNQENDMDLVYGYFMTLNQDAKKKFFVLLNIQAKDQITLRLLRDAYQEVCVKMQLENQDVHMWYVDDLSDFSKGQIKEGKKENICLLDKIDDAKDMKAILFGGLSQTQLERICAEDKIAVELLKLRGISEKHIISGGYYSLNPLTRAEKVKPEKRAADAQRYVVDTEIVVAQPKINPFEGAGAILDSTVVVNHIESCKVCTYLAKNDHEAKANDPKTIPISISPSRAKKGKIDPPRPEETELFNSLIAIVSEFPIEIRERLEYDVRFLFSARDLLGVEGELTEEKIGLINLYIQRMECFIEENKHTLKLEALLLFLKYISECKYYFLEMKRVVEAENTRKDSVGGGSLSSILSDYGFFGAASSSDSSSSAGPSHSLPDASASSSSTLNL